MDNLITSKEIDILKDQLQEHKDWGHLMEFINKYYNNRYLYEKKCLFSVSFSLEMKEGYECIDLFGAINDYPSRSITPYSDIIREFKKIGSIYHVVPKIGVNTIKDRQFSTKEQAISFAKEYINEVVDKDEPLVDIEIIGNGETILLRKEDYKRSFPELVESIRKSQYSLDEITEDILLNAFSDCYIIKGWVSYESTGWAGFFIESRAESHIEIWRNDDSNYGWGTDEIRIKNVPEVSLKEIIDQIKKVSTVAL